MILDLDCTLEPPGENFKVLKPRPPPNEIKSEPLQVGVQTSVLFKTTQISPVCRQV